MLMFHFVSNAGHCVEAVQRRYYEEDVALGLGRSLSDIGRLSPNLGRLSPDLGHLIPVKGGGTPESRRIVAPVSWRTGAGCAGALARGARILVRAAGVLARGAGVDRRMCAG